MSISTIAKAAPKVGVLILVGMYLSLGVPARAQNREKHVVTPALLATPHPWLAPPHAVHFSLGVEWRADWQAPISGLEGNLYRLGQVRLDCGISSNVVFQIRGPLRQVLDIEAGAAMPLPGTPSSGTTSDVGDFSLATIMRLWENRRKDFALGLRVETRLPNSTQSKGIGTNTTDIFLSAFAAKRADLGIVFADLGLGILTAPLTTNAQNDVLLYGLGAAWNMRQHVQIFGEINGYLTTRNVIPAGTEERGIARAGLAWHRNPWSVEASVEHGLTENEGTWGSSVNLVRRFSW